MKFLTATFTFLLFAFLSKAQIEMNSSGQVGIGAGPYSGTDFYVSGTSIKFNTNNHPLGYNILNFTGLSTGPFIFTGLNNFGHIGGSGRAFKSIYTESIHRTNEYTISDRTIKTNILPISDPLFLITQLQGVSFDYTQAAFPNTLPEIREELIEKNKGKYGFIAQDVAQILPKSVIYDQELELHLLSTDAIIPLLVESTKVQQATIDSLSAELENLQNLIMNSPLLNENNNSTDATSRSTISENQVAKLYQNYPNPFKDNTTIRYNLATSTTSATLNIYNMNGKQIRSKKLTQKGEGSITIRGRSLKAGMYLYTIIADGEVIDTKQFVLTK